MDELGLQLTKALQSGHVQAQIAAGQALFDAAGCQVIYSADNADCVVGDFGQGGGAQKAAKPRLTPQQVYQQVKASLTFDAPAPGVGPDHSVHHVRSEVTGLPLDSAVGYPLWFWAVGGDQQAKRVTKTAAGMTVSLSLRPTGLSIDPGDGKPFACSSMGTPWHRGMKPATPSPTCGHVYEKTGNYRVSMTTRWSIHYRVDDGKNPVLQGDEAVTGTRTRMLRIGELQVVVDG
ncbi:hypothetical protein FOE78_14560 [Microlunatus elymi]|uniref:PKD domain-containing protein n=1 Tax=Microlunatus elymi TaxID=2596828 RepID=A0A516Q0N3_9ACTN|nr:hypothetical protein [Microlunatus elymi]QDP96980.1 hypothetical protein FOE78_14560 [Microlunatus elymi]